MGDYFTENVEISKIYKFVETVIEFFDKNKKIEVYLKAQNESDSSEINHDNQYNKSQFIT